jgi:hypothetical protein
MAMNKKAQKMLGKKSASTPKSKMPMKSTKASKQLPRSLPSNASSIAKANAFGKKGAAMKKAPVVTTPVVGRPKSKPYV